MEKSGKTGRKLSLDEIKSRTASFLGSVPMSSGWYISDADQNTNLAMVSVSPSASDQEREEFKSLRGVIVDHSRRSIFYSSVDVKAESVVSDEIEEKNKDYDITYEYGLEGIHLRIFRYAGKNYMTSLRRFDVHRSTWGASPTFEEIYKDCNGPSFSELFNVERDYSTIVYEFYLVSPHLLNVSKLPITEKSFLYYLGHHRIPVNNVNQNDYAAKVWTPEKQVSTKSVEEAIKTGKILRREKLGYDEAVAFLRSGVSGTFHEKYFFGKGEFLYKRYFKNGILVKVEKVKSLAYAWRELILNCDCHPNYQLQMYLLYSQCRDVDENNLMEYDSKFPNLKVVDNADDLFLEDGNLDYSKFQIVENAIASVKNLRIYMTMLLAAPICRYFHIRDVYYSCPEIEEGFVSFLLGEEKYERMSQELEDFRNDVKREVRKKKEKRDAKVVAMEIFQEVAGNEKYKMLKEWKRMMKRVQYFQMKGERVEGERVEGERGGTGVEEGGR